MTILTYKGYQASVDYEDEHLVIQLLHIDDLISTICDDSREVEKTFHKLVDEYLETCRQLGREPKKPYKGSLNIRMLPELHRRVAMAASSAQISLNAWIVTACQEKLASIEKIDAERHIPAFTSVVTGVNLYSSVISGGTLNLYSYRRDQTVTLNRNVSGAIGAQIDVMDPTETATSPYTLRALPETKSADWLKRVTT